MGDITGNHNAFFIEIFVSITFSANDYCIYWRNNELSNRLFYAWDLLWDVWYKTAKAFTKNEAR
jgi:hypothetical protein